MTDQNGHNIAFTLGEIKGTLNEIKEYAKAIDAKVDRVAQDNDSRISSLETDRAYAKGAMRGALFIAGGLGTMFGAIGGALAAFFGVGN